MLKFYILPNILPKIIVPICSLYVYIFQHVEENLKILSNIKL